MISAITKSLFKFALLGLPFVALQLSLGQSLSNQISFGGRTAHCLNGLEIMMESKELSEIQMACVLHTLEDEGSTVNLFEKYGGLDRSALEAKIRDIHAVSQAKIQQILTPQQWDFWSVWISHTETRKLIRGVHLRQ